MRKLLPLGLTILSLTGLGACAETPRVQIVLPPAELAVCAGEPLAPDLPAHDWSSIAAAKARVAQRDAMVFDYALAMRGAWGDCFADVQGLKAWRESAAD